MLKASEVFVAFPTEMSGSDAYSMTEHSGFSFRKTLIQ